MDSPNLRFNLGTLCYAHEQLCFWLNHFEQVESEAFPNEWPTFAEPPSTYSLDVCVNSVHIVYYTYHPC